MATDKDDITTPITPRVTSKPTTGALGEKINNLHNDRREEIHQREGRGNSGRRGKGYTALIVIIVVLVLALLGLGAWVFFGSQEQGQQSTQEETAEENTELIEAQKQLMVSEMENLNREFEAYEASQRDLIVQDSVKVRLEEKYQKAKNQVEQLQRELRDAKNKSAAEIKALNDQIKVLRELLKQYLEEIDRLNKENEALRNENADLKNQNQNLSSQVSITRQENQVLNERMTLAEKLNVTGVSLTMLNKKDKNEKKLKNAKKLVVTFTIPQNNSTPVGTKTFYVRITSPEGQLLDGGGSFPFEGVTVQASARRNIDYGGEEIAGIPIYYDVRNVLNPGPYTVELFTDGYRIFSRQFELK